MQHTYEVVRPTIKSGDLLAWTHRKWASIYDMQIQAVRIFTESEFSHVGMAWVVEGRVFVIEAVTPKVRIYPLSKLLPFYLVPLNAPWNKETVEFALAQVGDNYSKWQAIQAFFGVPNLDELWSCAELVRQTMLHDGIDLGDICTPSKVVNEALKISPSGLILIES